MKIAISAISPNRDSAINSRFGCTAYFIVVDRDTLEWQAYPVTGVRASGGIGTQAAQYIANQGMEGVL